jgi:S1-C subfamily serine protease
MPAVEQMYRNAICQIHNTDIAANSSRPWQTQTAVHTTGSAFIVSGRLIVTNAHVIGQFGRASIVKVTRFQGEKRYVARILRVCLDFDLAVLTVDEEEFWRRPTEASSLELSLDVPDLEDSVRICGFPTFGRSFAALSCCCCQLTTSPFLPRTFLTV